MAHASVLDIDQKNYEYLQSLCWCRIIQVQIVDCAKIFLYKAQGDTNAAIAACIDINVNTAKHCIKNLRKVVLILHCMINHVLVQHKLSF